MNAILMIFFSFITCVLSSEEKELYPYLDLNFPTLLPKNFRLPTDPFKEAEEQLPSREGLEKLRASASGQFLPINLVLMLNKLPQDKKIIILDLREESHGYLNSMPLAWRLQSTTWTNMGKTLSEIEQDEAEKLSKLVKEKRVLLRFKDLQGSRPVAPLTLDVNRVATEKEFLENLNLNLGYIRIPITENHPPSPATVDRLVELIRTLPDDVWLHIHCHGGRGRTTSFLIMYDSIINGKKVSLDDILLRQKLLGGSDILKPLDLEDYRHVSLEERVRFVKKFYEYANTQDMAKTKYSDWIKNQK